MFLLEGGGSAVVGGIHPRTVPNQPDGTLDLDDVEEAIRNPDDPHFPQSRLICLENTHNRCAGAVLMPEYFAEVRALADRYGLAIHLDGARIFNAAVALDVAPSELTREADSVSFCLSKGLAAPVGSLVCGSEQFILQARRQRKLLGGGMRQAGVLAAAGIVGLETMVERLAEDHTNAQRLAQGLAGLPGILLDPAKVSTNILIFELSPSAVSAPKLAAGLNAKGIKIHTISEQRVRVLTHYGIDAEDVDYVLAAAEAVLGTGG
jgi:threonine aldolase